MVTRQSNVKLIVDTIQRLYPRELADSAWDNTGLLVDAAVGMQTRKLGQREAASPRVLLAIDLSAAVCDEARALRPDVVIAYHPLIFRPLKALSATNPQHVSIMRLIQSGISVYSPHTAVDARRGGVNDWLATAVTADDEAARETVQAVAAPPSGFEGAGYGRVVALREPVPLDTIVARVKQNLGLDTVQLVRARVAPADPAADTSAAATGDGDHSNTVQRIAVCAGSGASVLAGVDADVWVTGELGHHEMLALRDRGVSAIVCGHSNTERPFLPQLREELLAAFTAAGVDGACVRISEKDSEPITYA